MAKKMHDIVPPGKKINKATSAAEKKKKLLKEVADLKRENQRNAEIESKVATAKEIKQDIPAAVAMPATKPEPEPALEAVPTPAAKPIPKPAAKPESFIKTYPARQVYPEIPDAAVKKPRRFPWLELLAGGIVLAAILCVYLFFKLPKADVEIWPKQNTMALQETISASTAATAVDATHNMIPARYVEKDLQATQSFPATGLSSNNGNDATGTITVYNKISPTTPFTLVAGTHFLSDSGLFFVTLSRVTIPAAKGSVPGSVNVQVQAQQAGANYNIGASNFSIPKLNGTAYYYGIYGASTSAMSGGSSGAAKEVSSDDLQSAQDVLTKQLLAQAKTALQTSIGPDDVLLDGAITNTVVSASADAKAGATADNFNEQASVKVSALVFKKADVISFITSDIKSQLPSGSSFITSTISPNYTSESLDAKDDALSIILAPSVKTYIAMDTASLASLFAGQSAAGIKTVIDQKYPDDVSQLKVDFWPFWVSSAPDNVGRVKVNLNF